MTNRDFASALSKWALGVYTPADLWYNQNLVGRRRPLSLCLGAPVGYALRPSTQRNRTSMVKIRLRRTGKTKQPSYRVVVADSRSPRDGKFIEIIGHYNPIRRPKVLEIKADRARYWLGVGAQPSDTVAGLLKQVNVLDAEGKLTPAEVATATVEA
jgi:small subunit ribosomal protein S16